MLKPVYICCSNVLLEERAYLSWQVNKVNNNTTMKVLTDNREET